MTFSLEKKKKTGGGLIGCISLYGTITGGAYKQQFMVWSNKLQQHYNQECGN